MFHSMQGHLGELHHPRTNWAEERKSSKYNDPYCPDWTQNENSELQWRRRILEGFVHGPDLFLAKE